MTPHAAGTTRVKGVDPKGLIYPYELIKVDGMLFSAYDPSRGYELWKGDRTARGTTLVDDIVRGADGSQLGNLANLNGTLFFHADDGTHENELWRTKPVFIRTSLRATRRPWAPPIGRRPRRGRGSPATWLGRRASRYPGAGGGRAPAQILR